jgi:ABC-type cobalamin/Fe3+-siderophores transport system ATPase subunit
VVLSRGVVVAVGPPVEVLIPTLIERVWNVRADVDVVDGVASIRFLRRSRAEGGRGP